MNASIISLPASPAPEMAPPFPAESFPSLVQSIASDMARVYQVPTNLTAMSALAVLSGAIGKSVTVRGGYKNDVTRLNLYVMGVAERGAGKSSIGEKLIQPIADQSRLVAERHHEAVARKRGEVGILKKEIARFESDAANATGAERDNLRCTLENKQARLADLEVEAQREPTLWVSDTTSEALGRALADNDEVLFSYSSEAGGAMKVALGKYTDQGDYELLLAGYKGDAVKMSRVSRRTVQLDQPCLAMLWMMQGCVIRQLLRDSEASERGLTARMLIFDTGARREHDNRSTESFTLPAEWIALVEGIVSSRATVREIGCTAGAREVFAKFHDEGVDQERAGIVEYGEFSRQRENAIKVAGLFAVVENATVIAEQRAEAAVAVVRWCGRSFLGLRRTAKRDGMRSDLDRVLGLVDQHAGAVNVGVLAREHGISRTRLDEIVAAFANQLVIERKSTGGPGRPAEMLTRPLNPLNQLKGA